MSNNIFILLKVVVRLTVFLSSANQICLSTDISKCFIEPLGVRESTVYMFQGSNITFKCQVFSLKDFVCVCLSTILFIKLCSFFFFFFFLFFFFFFCFFFLTFCFCIVFCFVYFSSFLSINKVSLGVTKCPGLYYGTSAQLASV